MSQIHDGQPPACELCGKPAVKEHLHGESRALVCARCGEQLQARDAYEDKLIHLSTLEMDGQYDDALACLDHLLQTHRQWDHDLWLARSVADRRAFIFWRAGRFSEAEAAYDAAAGLGFENVTYRWSHALGRVRLLEAMDRKGEALTVLEEALGEQDSRYLASAVSFLAELGRLAEELGQPLDAKWLAVARDAADSYGVGLPAGQSVAQILVALEDKVDGMLPRYARDAAGDPEEKPRAPSRPGGSSE